MNSLSVISKITIKALPEKVWEVLTVATYIRQWDELPEDFSAHQIAKGTEIIWRQPDGNTTKLKITQFDENRRLKMNLYVSRWPNPETSYDIAYTYILAGNGDTTDLTVTIGDFAALASGQNYYDASLDTAETGLKKIAELAEQG